MANGTITDAKIREDAKAIFAVFIGAIIGIVFLASIADSVFVQSNTVSVSNNTITAPATNASVSLTGRELATGNIPITLNASNASGLTLQDLGVFIDTRVINGVLTVALNVNQTGNAFAATDINVTYVYEPQGYLQRSVDRNIVALITLFGALAILITVIIIFIMNGTFGDLIGRMKGRRRS